MNKVILFDFDGVIVDSMSVRDEGFLAIAKNATSSKEIIKEFLEYHRYNGGMSRFEKIRYLYEVMLGRSITSQKIEKIAKEFSALMKSKLTNKNILIVETVDFIKSIYQDIALHIVSGSEEKELNFLCEKLELSQYFITIEGSPTHKNILVENILKKYNYDKKETILIGDSITDYNAAIINGIDFYGYNNIDLKKYENYIENFKEFRW